jgi:hypothetical protein
MFHQPSSNSQTCHTATAHTSAAIGIIVGPVGTPRPDWRWAEYPVPIHSIPLCRSFRCCDRGGQSTCSRRPSLTITITLLLVDNDYHPHAHLALVANQRRAVNPLVLPLLISSTEPPYFCGNSSSVSECRRELLTNSVRAANLVQERRLQYAR